MEPILQLEDGEIRQKVLEVTQELRLSDDVINKVAEVMEQEAARGLSGDKSQQKQSSLIMENTFVRLLPDDSDNGEFLGLDLGGTNFRFILLELRAGKIERAEQEGFKFEREILQGTVQQLYDFLAGALETFLEHQGLLKRTSKLSLGFTFSFPIHQKALDDARLVTWTKSFKVKGGSGENMCRYFKEAIARRGLPVEVVVIQNDVTGTLLTGAQQDKRCRIGMVVGTGCNAGYVERLERVGKWTGDDLVPRSIIVDPEWGSLGDNGVMDFAKSRFDRLTDQQSTYPSSYSWEKMLSGFFLGETARHVLVELCQQGALVGGHASANMLTHGTFPTEYISEIVGDETDDLRNSRAVLEKCEYADDTLTLRDLHVVKFVCQVISYRTSRLIAACLSVLVRRVGERDLTVAADGSLYKYHPTLRRDIQAEMKRLLPHTNVTFMTAEDGGGRGGALVAAVAVRMRQMGLYLGEQEGV